MFALGKELYIEPTVSLIELTQFQQSHDGLGRQDVGHRCHQEMMLV